MLRKAFLTCAARRTYHTTSPNSARVLASDAIEKICGDSFRARGHELVEKPGMCLAVAIILNKRHKRQTNN